MNRQALVGAFVVGGTILLMAAFVFFGNLHPFQHKQKAVMIFRGATSGLSIGAPVTFRGVQVGAVTRVAIAYDAQTQEAFIPVYVTLNRDNIGLLGKRGQGLPTVTELVRQGLRAEMNLKSFVTGTSEIDLDFAPNSPATLHPDLVHGVEIPTRQSPIQAVTQTLTELPLKEIADNTNVALAGIRSVADHLDHDLPPLVQSVQATSDHSREMVDAARQLVEALRPELEQTLKNVNKLATTGTAQLDASGHQLQTLLTNSNATVLKAGKTLDNFESMTSLRSSERANLEASLRDIAAAAAALRGFANDVERNPQLLLMGRRP
ncbi:MlaD family protein [Brytella acorum]|uniref:MlaD family protein n=1 Tax=Brytella acorum TaxID=2959299 RepID=A0AA35UHG4_9PROT|nr:MlaD family protein [Brytella acorum]MDF3624948.1 MlaD family protein [Brytella acorum]CAI9121431.1 MlaD family protein [Brytella acorum]